jgi:hypothetical protein
MEKNKPAIIFSEKQIKNQGEHRYHKYYGETPIKTRTSRPE